MDYVEFLAATLHLARLERDDRLHRAFRHFDVDGSGFITREALEAGLSHLGTVCSWRRAWSSRCGWASDLTEYAPHRESLEMRDIVNDIAKQLLHACRSIWTVFWRRLTQTATAASATPSSVTCCATTLSPQ